MVTAIPQQRRVMLHLGGYLSGQNGRGFTLCLTPAHIPVIEKLLTELYGVGQCQPPQPENYRYAIQIPAL